jgi:hypothetical protein
MVFGDMEETPILGLMGKPSKSGKRPNGWIGVPQYDLN